MGLPPWQAVNEITRGVGLFDSNHLSNIATCFERFAFGVPGYRPATNSLAIRPVEQDRVRSSFPNGRVPHLARSEQAKEDAARMAREIQGLFGKLKGSSLQILIATNLLVHKGADLNGITVDDSLLDPRHDVFRSLREIAGGDPSQLRARHRGTETNPSFHSFGRVPTCPEGHGTRNPVASSLNERVS